MWHSYIFRKCCKFWQSTPLSCQKRCSKKQKIWHQWEALYGQQISSHIWYLWFCLSSFGFLFIGTYLQSFSGHFYCGAQAGRRWNLSQLVFVFVYGLTLSFSLCFCISQIIKGVFIRSGEFLRPSASSSQLGLESVLHINNNLGQVSTNFICIFLSIQTVFLWVFKLYFSDESSPITHDKKPLDNLRCTQIQRQTQGKTKSKNKGNSPPFTWIAPLHCKTCSTCLFVLQKPFCLPLEILFLLKYVGGKKYPQWLLPQNLMLISFLLSLLFASHHLQAEYGPQVNCECWKSGISEIKVVLFEICQYKVLSWNIEQLPSSMSSNLSNKSFLAQVHLPRYSQII